jgi:hypothetical protein
MVVNVCLNNRHCKVRINVASQVNINSKTKSIVITCIFLFDEDSDVPIVLKLTRDLAQEMCCTTCVSRNLSNTNSARLRILCNNKPIGAAPRWHFWGVGGVRMGRFEKKV